MQQKALDRLRAAAAGKTVEEDAAETGCTGMTISNWRKKAMVALGARNLPNAIALAYETGLFKVEAAVRPSAPLPGRATAALEHDTFHTVGEPERPFFRKHVSARKPLRRVDVVELNAAFCTGRGCDRELDSADRRIGDGLCAGCRAAESLPAQTAEFLATGEGV
jgi:hypothetical protein